MKTRPNHFCFLCTDPQEAPLFPDGKYKGQIIEIQGLTWFETEDLAWQYWGFMNDEFKAQIGPVQVINEEDLPYHFDCNSEYIKAKLTGTRLLKSKEPVGVRVTNNQKAISEYYKQGKLPADLGELK